ncbi:MAG: TetR/AcrR family transcriptional regulator [Pseudomonadales bacterium]
MSQITPAKHKILLAAAAVCTEHGASHLTLDRVAEQADLSKGGLLYHYPNKQALLEGMLGYLVGTISDRQLTHEQALQGSRRPFAMSVLLGEIEQEPAERAMAQAILAVAAEDPKLLAAAKPVIAQWLARAHEEDAVSVAIVLAAQGLRFLQMLDMLPTEPDSGPTLTAQLQQLVEQAP